MAKCVSSVAPGDAAPWPTSILLAEEGYIGASSNETTATAESRLGLTVEVTFWIDAPPATSFFTFHCSMSPDSDCENADVEIEPHVVGAEGPFVLIRTRFKSGDGEYEYFMYKADPVSPFLECVPIPDDDTALMGVTALGIVPHSDGENFLLISLCDSMKHLDYRFHIYSSENRTWTTKEAKNPCPQVHKITPNKVFMIRDGVICWVDYWQGVLVCDFLQEPLHATYFPLPEPFPVNRPTLKLYHPGDSPRRFRDVAYINGMFKFIEMEHRKIPEEIPEIRDAVFDPSHKDVLYDSDLIILSKIIDVDRRPRKPHTINGWRALIWTRELGSNCWLKRCAVDVDDILVNDSAYSVLLSGQRDETPTSFTFRNMFSAWPILSTEANDLLYLKSFMNMDCENGWVLAVNLAEKTLKVEAFGAHPFDERYVPTYQILRLCTLSNHLKMAPGIKVSTFFLSQQRVSTLLKIPQPCSSTNGSNNTAIGGGEPNSYEPKNKRPRPSVEKVSHAQNGAEGTV